MRYILAAAIVSVAFVAVETLGAQSSRPANRLERDFVANGKISMDLSAGEYRITGIPENRIRLAWHVRNDEDVDARADIRGSDARIVTDGPMNHFSVDIDIPQRSNLYIRLTAGELR